MGEINLDKMERAELSGIISLELIESITYLRKTVAHNIEKLRTAPDPSKKDNTETSGSFSAL